MKHYIISVILLGTFTALVAFHPLCWLSFAVGYVFWGSMLLPMLGNK